VAASLFPSCVIGYDTFIYCNLVSNGWKWSVNVYKNRKETIIYKRRDNTHNNTQKMQKHRIHKIENKHAEYYET